jgi:biopolymer transport protein ExbD
MGAAIGTGEKKSPNIELNIVPFIDMMSCITAFLLVTAVWVNTANVPTHVGGRNRDGLEPQTPDPKLSVLVEKDKIWVGVSRLDDFTQIDRNGNEWSQLEDALKTQKKSTWFADKHDIEVAALSTAGETVPYSNLITAMDVAAKAGFDDVVVTEPGSLSATPHQM